MKASDSKQARWAYFRFSVIGHLLAAPPQGGELKKALTELSEKTWQHPITENPVTFSYATLERWFYQAQNSQNPVNELRSKRRTDADRPRQLSDKLKIVIQHQYREHASWSYQLHLDNLAVIVEAQPELGPLPSYSTLRRYMKANGLCKKRNLRRFHTPGAEKAAQRLEQREVRSYEVEHVNSLWHLDFHHGSRKILGKEGLWHKALLLSIIDDHSRLICHAQWYLDETVESLVHGFTQALQKRALPRALMTDNGSAMVAAEFTEGLKRLSILHETTLPYSPYQNAKQESVWGQIEGRLMAMLEGESELTLDLLNNATLAYIEFEYHHKRHSEINETPLERYVKGHDVGRACPDSQTLKSTFCTEVKRKQRKSDGSFTLEGQRFEVPSAYRHLEKLSIRYARWDLRHVLLVDPHTNTILTPLYPQDKVANADAKRRALSDAPTHTEVTSTGIAPLLKDLMAQYAATGLPPAYLPKGKSK